jgi:hypothetical protein
MSYANNFELSEKAKSYAQKLIEKTHESRSLFGGLVCKSNIKLDDAFECIYDECEAARIKDSQRLSFF